jgi:hypothetical protein
MSPDDVLLGLLNCLGHIEAQRAGQPAAPPAAMPPGGAPQLLQQLQLKAAQLELAMGLQPAAAAEAAAAGFGNPQAALAWIVGRVERLVEAADAEEDGDSGSSDGSGAYVEIDSGWAAAKGASAAAGTGKATAGRGQGLSVGQWRQVLGGTELD